MERPDFRRDPLPGRPVLAALSLCLAAALGAGSAGADVLVLRDGSRIETQGKWEVKGRQLVFKTATGTLSALRATEVDLPASEKATAEAAAPKAEVAQPAPDKRPVLVLTNKDVAGASPEDSAAAPAGAAQAPSGKVEVVRSSLESAGTAEVAYNVRGAVQNNSPQPVAEISLMAIVAVSREQNNRRVYCQTTLPGPVQPKAEVEFSCPISQREVTATGMAEAFSEAVLSFELRSRPMPAPTP